MKDFRYLGDISARLARADEWSAASSDERVAAATFLRDVSLYALENELPEGVVEDLLAATASIEPQFTARVSGITVSFHPSAHMKLLRFVDLSEMERERRDLFARPSEKMPHLSAVFVDPREYNFQTFENIVPIDRLTRGVRLGVKLTRHVAHRDDVHTFSIKPNAHAGRLLGDLDALDLYVRPLDTNARGGLRYLFHSAALAQALARSVRAALPPEMLEGFSHVNPVFLCIRFSPGDAPFDAHVDAPFYDPNRGHVSRHTLILYLTGGDGPGALDVDGVAFDTIAPMTAAVFHQRLEHSGAPFVEGDKVFVRSELVYDVVDARLEHDPEIARVFSRACYMDHQSLFHPELSGYMQRCYDRVSRAHWEGLSEDEAPTPFVHKTFRGVDFLADGHDFWFRDDVALEQCAALAVIDYFNGYFKRGRKAFNQECSSRALQGREGASWITQTLRDLGPTEGPGLGVFPKQRLFPGPGYEGKTFGAIDYTHTYWGDEGDTSPGRFDESIRSVVRDEKARQGLSNAQAFARQRVDPAPMIMLGKSMYLDPEKILVDGDKIYMASEHAPEPFNFAADVYNESLCVVANFLGVDVKVDAPYLLIPPILWRQVDGCYHLSLDMFHNDWMVEKSARVVPIPRLRGVKGRRYGSTSLSEDDAPWFNAAREIMTEDERREAEDTYRDTDGY